MRKAMRSAGRESRPPNKNIDPIPNRSLMTPPRGTEKAYAQPTTNVNIGTFSGPNLVTNEGRVTQVMQIAIPIVIWPRNRRGQSFGVRL
uniref:Uncharacterized protein n=1 Tax=uncultured organism TaxID=155900 RepID=M1QB28_9ZZZZ|nr:hypothetical protein FLSS-19_0026 [uncultured organism]